MAVDHAAVAIRVDVTPRVVVVLVAAVQRAVATQQCLAVAAKSIR